MSLAREFPQAAPDASLILRRCPRCKLEKHAEAFTPVDCYCRACRGEINTEYAQKRKLRYASQPAISPADTPEHRLRVAMLAYMREFGFSRLRVTYTRLEGEIARSKRIELAREGWIA